LDLGFNPIATQGAGALFEAVGASTSLEHFAMNGPDDRNNDHDVRTGIIDLNDCHDSLRTMLEDTSRLVRLDVGQHAHHLGLNAIQSLAAGLVENVVLKHIKLPWLNLEFIDIIGEALTKNRSIESINVFRLGRLPELGIVEEEHILSFISMLPRMTSLTCIEGLFDFISTEQIRQALVAALKENPWLKEIDGRVRMEGHVCHDDAVQFYLQLNRLGRGHYLAAPENSAVPVGVLPHLFSRMTGGPEYASHLHYFLRHTSPYLFAGQPDNNA
jgi:hypothetical protein